MRARAGDVILKWGRGYGGYPNVAKVVNPVICSDKLYQGANIAGAGLPIPKIYRNSTEWQQDGYPDLVYKPREGEGGRGIAHSTRHTNPPNWGRFEGIYQRYIPKVKEFRAVQIGNLSAYIMEKTPPHGDSSVICWNLHQGSEWRRLYTYPAPLRGIYRDINRLAEQAIIANHYDLAGVDIMQDGEGQLWILECNSRPGLGPDNLRLFVQAFTDWAASLA